ncbi:MAG TPA: DUF2203 domain-containing protein [Pyrinomonadaceae bacterium]|nr:DUF2203 domain-containing protein [Pyrinomonadaceae bacterium]
MRRLHPTRPATQWHHQHPTIRMGLLPQHISRMKLFTVEEANSLLPNVRPIVHKIQRAHRRLETLQSAAKRAASGAEHGGGGIPNGQRYAQLLVDLSIGASELETLGIQLKDYGHGLIDFPSMRDGRVVLLCWKADEGDNIEWWHDVEAGFAGRQPL